MFYSNRNNHRELIFLIEQWGKGISTQTDIVANGLLVVRVEINILERNMLMHSMNIKEDLIKILSSQNTNIRLVQSNHPSSLVIGEKAVDIKNIVQRRGFTNVFEVSEDEK